MEIEKEFREKLQNYINEVCREREIERKDTLIKKIQKMEEMDLKYKDKLNVVINEVAKNAAWQVVDGYPIIILYKVENEDLTFYYDVVKYSLIKEDSFSYYLSEIFSGLGLKPWFESRENKKWFTSEYYGYIMSSLENVRNFLNKGN